MGNSRPTVVFDLRRYLPGGWYLPGAFIVQQDSDGKFTHILQNASPITVGGHGIELTPLLVQLFTLIESLSAPALEAKFNPPKGKPKPLETLLEHEEVKRQIERFVHRQMDVFLRKMLENRLPLTFMAEKKVLLHDVLINYPDLELTPHLIFRRTKDGVKYRLNFSLGDDRWLVRWKKDLTVLTNQPGWLFVDNTLHPLPDLNGNMVKPFFQKDEIAVPSHLLKTYFEKFVMRAVEKTEIEAEGFEVTGTRKLEGCELALVKHLFKDSWFVTVKFRYLGATFSENDSREMRTALHFQTGENGQPEIRIMQVRRQREAETQFLKRLESQGFGQTEASLWQLPEAFRSQTGMSENGKPGTVPVADRNQRNEIGSGGNDLSFFEAADWLAAHRDELQAAGFTLEMPVFEDKKITLAPASWSQEVQTERDWFDVRIMVQVGEHNFPFSRLVGHIRANDRFFPLPDGTFFLIPAEWMSRFHGLAHLGKMEGDSLRLAKSQRPLLSSLGWSDAPENAEKQAVEFQHSSLLKATLRPYQEAGTRWLAQHYHEGLGACLADDMGLGKTLQTLAILLFAKEKRKETASSLNPHSSTLFDDFQPLQALIILPASLVFNWEREVKKFAPLVQVCKHVGQGRTKDARLLRRFDLVLTTYQTAQRDVDLLQKIEWEYIVLDESQYIKNPESQAFKAIGELNARHKISLSGTPIENSLRDLWAQMQFLNPGMLGSLPAFKKNYIQPIEKQGDEVKKEELRSLVQPYLLRRTKEEVAPDLPELTETIFYSEMSEAQRKLYEREKSAVRNQLLNIGDPAAHQIQVLAALTRLRQIANHPKLSASEQASAGENGVGEEGVEMQNLSSGKFEDVLEFWETVRKSGHKALIFSSFEKHLQLFRAHFEAEKYRFAWLTGDVSQAQRKAEVERFQSDPSVQAFFITLKAGGVGLNLTAADYVFVLDPWWNPAVENQAIARAHRIGQEKKVQAVRFIARDSIEEKILQLQERKSKLAGEFLAAPERVASSREGLAELLA